MVKKIFSLSSNNHLTNLAETSFVVFHVWFYDFWIDIDCSLRLELSIKAFLFFHNFNFVQKIYPVYFHAVPHNIENIQSNWKPF